MSSDIATIFSRQLSEMNPFDFRKKKTNKTFGRKTNGNFFKIKNTFSIDFATKCLKKWIEGIPLNKNA